MFLVYLMAGWSAGHWSQSLLLISSLGLMKLLRHCLAQQVSFWLQMGLETPWCVWQWILSSPVLGGLLHSSQHTAICSSGKSSTRFLHYFWVLSNEIDEMVIRDSQISECQSGCHHWTEITKLIGLSASRWGDGLKYDLFEDKWRVKAEGHEVKMAKECIVFAFDVTHTYSVLLTTLSQNLGVGKLGNIWITI